MVHSRGDGAGRTEGAPPLPADLFRAALDRMQDAVIVTGARGPDGTEPIVYVNAAFETMTGYTADEVTGLSPRLLQPHDAERAVLDAARTAIESGRPFEGRLTNRRKDGTLFDIEWRVSPLRDALGAITHWIAIARDVTQTERTARHLARAHEQMRLTVGAVCEGVLDWDVGSGALWWSDRLAAILGLPRDAPPRIETFVNRIVPGDRARLRAAIDRHFATKAPLAVECVLLHPDGPRMMLAVTGQATWDAAGIPVRLVAAVRDVTADRALRARMLAAEEIAGVGHYVIDITARSVVWSPQMYVLQGLDPERFTPDFDNSLDGYHPDDRDRVGRIVAEAMRARTGFEFEARLRRPSGEVRHVRARGEIRLTARGDPYEVFGVLQDRTDIVLKERQLEQAQRLQAFGQLAGGVAHDFNNLLAVIMGNAELLRDIAADRLTDDDREMLDEAIRAVLRGRTLTDSLLSFARAAPLRPRALRVDDFAREVREVLARTLPATIDVRFETEPEVWPIYADRGNLQGALYNLALNARDAMPEGGRLTIAARNRRLDEMRGGRTPGPYVELAVTDTGTGIAPEHLPRVFEPFFTTKPVGQGSGLGLARVQGFAEQSGGAADLRTEPGRGTTVTLLLPAHGVNATALDAPDTTVSPSIAPIGTRVLLAEDMTEVRRVLRHLLERDGFVVIEAASGDEAYDRFRADPAIDLVLTDVVMPGTLQGPGLVRRLRDKRPDLPVIYVSGYPGEARRAGDDDPTTAGVRLMKPVSVQDLRAAVRRALKEPPRLPAG